MIWRIFIIAACLTVLSSVLLRGQGPDAQDLTQSVFDQNKGADPTNSDRALTDKIQQRPDVRIQQVPLPTAAPQKPVVDDKTLKQIEALRKEKKAFVQKERQRMLSTLRFAQLDEAGITNEANQAWEKKKPDAAQELRRLEAKVSAEKAHQKSETKKDETRISDVPLPSRTR